MFVLFAHIYITGPKPHHIRICLQHILLAWLYTYSIVYPSPLRHPRSTTFCVWPRGGLLCSSDMFQDSESAVDREIMTCNCSKCSRSTCACHMVGFCNSAELCLHQ